jgi:hypothetical protein
MLHEGVRTHVRSLSDEDLIAYVDDTAAGYTPEAIAFAREEVKARGLDDGRLQALRQSVQARNDERRSEIQEEAQRPLGWFGRIAFVVIGLPGPIIALALWLRFREQGERQKIWDMLLFGLMGTAIQYAGFKFGIPPWSWLVEGLGRPN